MRMHPATTLLAVVDLQERLIAAIPAAPAVVGRAVRLARAAGLLDVRTVLTEQYPRGLGPTPQELASLLPPAAAKLTFSCCGCEAFATLVDRPEAGVAGIASVVLCGVETHVCIAQTALDLLARGINVFVAVDGVASRHPIDHDTALRRLEGAGAILTTSEAAIFEWCRSAEHPRFQEVRRLLTG